jgi:hypothetical protein
MAIEIFNRYENKYLVNEETAAQIQDRLSDYMELDPYSQQQGTYLITNIYYDTADHHLIRTSLAKPAYKEKLRLRAYGIPQGDSEVYVEIKKKVGGLVNKRRSAMKLQEAYRFLHSGEAPEDQPGVNRQVVGEIACILQRQVLQPVLYLAYDRRAYFGRGQHDLRVSFDRNVQTRRDDLRLESGLWGQQLLAGDLWIMEIKVARSIPLWLCRLLSGYKIYPSSFSKYGTEYMRWLEHEQKPKMVATAPQAVFAPIRGKFLTAAIAQ